MCKREEIGAHGGTCPSGTHETTLAHKQQQRLPPNPPPNYQHRECIRVAEAAAAAAHRDSQSSTTSGEQEARKEHEMGAMSRKASLTWFGGICRRIS